MQIYAPQNVIISHLHHGTGLQGQTSPSLSFWPVILLMILNPWHKSTGESQFVIAGAEDNLIAQIRDIHDSLAIRWSKCDPIPWAVMMTNVKWSQGWARAFSVTVGRGQGSPVTQINKEHWYSMHLPATPWSRQQPEETASPSVYLFCLMAKCELWISLKSKNLNLYNI